jgi:hypothetical protein
MWGGKEGDTQEEVKSPAVRVPCDIWAQNTIPPVPAFAGMYIAQCAPNTAPDTTARPTRQCLELDI